MKTYIILSHSISNIGGCERYIRAKKIFLEQHNYKVLVISYLYSEKILQGLEEFEKWNISYLFFDPVYYSKTVIDNVISRITDFCRDSESVYIESTQIKISLWGELLAKHLNAKHIIFDVNENTKCVKSMKSFLEFKLQRKELAGINEKNLSGFSGKYEVLAAAGGTSDVVVDYYYPQFDDMPESDYTIGSIGRLNKPYINDMIDEIVLFARKHLYKKINLILIGDEHSQIIIKNIQKTIKKAPNIYLILTGTLDNIPLSFFKISDVVVASAGSATLSARNGAITVSIDTNDHLPIGILGYTTKKSTYRDCPPDQSLSQLLEKILVEKYHINMEYIGLKNNKTVDEKLAEHLNFIENTEKIKKYFDTTKIRYYKFIVFAVIKIHLLMCGLICGEKDFNKQKFYYFKIRGLLKTCLSIFDFYTKPVKNRRKYNKFKFPIYFI